MAYKIDTSKCIGCHTCLAVCPMGAISVGKDGKCIIGAKKCVSCGSCAAACPVGAIAIDRK